jgi:hypothetical protein
MILRQKQLHFIKQICLSSYKDSPFHMLRNQIHYQQEQSLLVTGSHNTIMNSLFVIVLTRMPELSNDRKGSFSEKLGNVFYNNLIWKP